MGTILSSNEQAALSYINKNNDRKEEGLIKNSIKLMHYRIVNASTTSADDNVNNIINNDNYTDDLKMLPKFYDFRKHKLAAKCPSFNQIHDQGSCGSCWAVQAMSVFSDRACLHTN